MLLWLWKMKKKEKKQELYDMVLRGISMVVLGICLNIMIKMSSFVHSNSYEKELRRQTVKDAFFQEKATVVVWFILLITGLVSLFCLVVIALKTIMDLKKIKGQIAYFEVVGYRYIENYLYLAKMVELIMVAIIAYFFSQYVWMVLSTYETFLNLFLLAGVKREFSIAIFEGVFILIAVLEYGVIFMWKKMEEKENLAMRLKVE